MLAKFYWVNTNGYNCIYINFMNKWCVDGIHDTTGMWCGIDIYETSDDYNSAKEYYQPAINKLKDFLKNPEAQGYEFERDYIENLDEIEAYGGKTIDEIEEFGNDIVYIGEYDIHVTI